MSRLNKGGIEVFDDNYDRIFKRGKYAETDRKTTDTGELQRTPEGSTEPGAGGS